MMWTNLGAIMLKQVPKDRQINLTLLEADGGYKDSGEREMQVKGYRISVTRGGGGVVSYCTV